LNETLAADRTPAQELEASKHQKTPASKTGLKIMLISSFKGLKGEAVN